MRKYGNIVLGKVYVGLDSLHAGGDSTVKCAHGVFWVLGFVASMSDGLRHFETCWPFPRKGP